MTEPAYDFAALPPKQLEALGNISIGLDEGVNPRTAAALVRRGLIEEREQVLPGRIPVTVKRYEMPIHVHIRWCEWCAANYVPGEDD